MDNFPILQTATGPQFGWPANTQIAIAMSVPLQHRRQARNDHVPFKGTPKELRAIALRGSAVILISQFGRPGAPTSRNRICSEVEVPFGHYSRVFISLSLADPQFIELVEANPSAFPYFMRYSVDIWTDGKVLNLEWDDFGTIEIGHFTRGPWEDYLIALASEAL